MIIVNTDFVKGREISETLGLVRGSTIRAKHLGKDIMAGLKNIATAVPVTASLVFEF